MSALLGRLTKPSQHGPYMDDEAGPIQRLEWGRYIIDGEVHGSGPDGDVGAGKDICLLDGEVTAWPERHGHRLKASMIARLYHLDIDTLIIGLGVHGRIRCPASVRRQAQLNGIREIIAVPTPEACRRYNELYHQGRRVALLAHGTC